MLCAEVAHGHMFTPMKYWRVIDPIFLKWPKTLDVVRDLIPMPVTLFRIFLVDSPQGLPYGIRFQRVSLHLPIAGERENECKLNYCKYSSIGKLFKLTIRGNGIRPKEYISQRSTPKLHLKQHIYI